MSELKGKRAVMLMADNFQDEEGVEPVAFLREQGVEVDYVGLKTGTAKGKYGRHEVEVDKTVGEVNAGDYDLLMIPGGAAPERLRLNEAVLEFTRAFVVEGKPVAAICHGPQVLISAGVLAGRTVTCYEGIRDDVRLAGARYVDKKVMVDGALVTSRTPDDIPDFNTAMLELLKEPEPAPEKKTRKKKGAEETAADSVESLDVALADAPETEPASEETPATA